MRIVAIANQKGGCGKTTSSINFAACLAHLRKKVLLIDLDPQGHSGCGLSAQPDSFHYLSEDLFQPFFDPLKQILSLTSHLSIIPAGNGLAKYDHLDFDAGKSCQLFRNLQNGANRYWDFDYLVFDCPPQLGALTQNALHAADDVIIPIEPSFFSLHGLAKISETLEKIRSNRQSPITIHALLTIFDSRTGFSKEVYENVKRHFGKKLFKAIIHESVLLKEASSAGQSIVDYAPYSQAFRDYDHLTVEFLERQLDKELPEQKESIWEREHEKRFGPRRVFGGVLFQFANKSAKHVEIAGDFNHWIPESLVFFEAEGVWKKVLSVPSGSHRYKFIVDGEWQVDPHHPVYRQNDFGTQDTYLEVG